MVCTLYWQKYADTCLKCFPDAPAETHEASPSRLFCLLCALRKQDTLGKKKAIYPLPHTAHKSHSSPQVSLWLTGEREPILWPVFAHDSWASLEFELAIFRSITFILLNFDLWVHKPQSCELIESKTAFCWLVIKNGPSTNYHVAISSNFQFTVYLHFLRTHLGKIAILTTNMINMFFSPPLYACKDFLVSNVGTSANELPCMKKGQSWAALFQLGLQLIFRPVAWRQKAELKKLARSTAW